MLPYWLMFLAPALVAAGMRGTRAAIWETRHPLAWGFVWLSLTVLIGFREQVGGDWGSYEKMLNNTAGLGFLDVLSTNDPGYSLLNWCSLAFDFDVYGVNLVGGAIFAFGLVTFCRAQPQPWLALAVAVPYLVIVVAMGYSRQAIALGFILLGLVALADGSMWKFAIWVALGATFHRTAVLVLPIAALASSKNKYWTAAWISLLGVGMYKALLEKDADNLYQNYVAAEMQSEGALIRALMGAVPAIIFLLWRKRFHFRESEAALWRWLASISAALPFVLLVTSASTVVDRMALYVLPLQLVVFSRLPDSFVTPETEGDISSAGASSGIRVAILAYYGAVLFIWLNFANHAYYWLPYRFYPLEALL
ncbi:EpsG family protein [Methylosinus sp. Ce-a6]|uniref:EpsG family protein n=1 Tax=Methylosinus sp. Ce-a6 TaxID=2172005 RepID=UPI001359C0D9|nr:EpsG family protein [Methylosinus sp. Ce-a6]